MRVGKLVTFEKMNIMLKFVVSRFDDFENWRDGDEARGRIEGGEN